MSGLRCLSFCEYLSDLAAMGMQHLVEAAMFAIVMDMAVKQRASATCRLGSVSAKTIQRVTRAAGAGRVIMEIPGRYVVQKDSYIVTYLFVIVSNTQKTNKQTPWSESASELYRPSDRRLSAKWLPTCADRGCHVGSMTDPYGRILGFLDRSRYFSIK
jgi:hypothetical protein